MQEKLDYMHRKKKLLKKRKGFFEKNWPCWKLDIKRLEYLQQQTTWLIIIIHNYKYTSPLSFAFFFCI
jgi:hypothetical protein